MFKIGAEESMSFLIGLIMVVLFLIPIGIYLYSIGMQENKLQYTVDSLAENISKLQDSQKKSLLLYTGKPNEFTLMGFDSGQNDFGSEGLWDCNSYGSLHLALLGKIKKPQQCGSKPCICSCPVTSANFKGACESSTAVCSVINTDYQLKFSGRESECEYGPFITNRNELADIKMQRSGNLVGVCLQGDCIDLNQEKATEVYDSFIAQYTGCINSQNENCLCDDLDLSQLPEGYKIRIASSDGVTKIGLLSEQKRLATSNFNDNYLCSYIGDDNTNDIPSLEVSKDEPGDYADGKIIHFYKKTRQVICAAGKRDDSFSYLREKRPCTSQNDESVSLT